MSMYGGVLKNTRGSSLAIYHLRQTIRHILTKDNIHVYTMEMIAGEYLIRLSLVYYSTCFTDNKVLALKITSQKMFS